MLKLEPSSDGEPKDEPEMIDDQGPSFEELMMLVFAGPMRFEHPDEIEEEAEMATEEAEMAAEEGSGDSPGA